MPTLTAWGRRNSSSTGLTYLRGTTEREGKRGKDGKEDGGYEAPESGISSHPLTRNGTQKKENRANEKNRLRKASEIEMDQDQKP